MKVEGIELKRERNKSDHCSRVVQNDRDRKIITGFGKINATGLMPGFSGMMGDEGKLQRIDKRKAGEEGEP